MAMLWEQSGGAAEAEARCRRRRLLQKKRRTEQELESATKLGRCQVKLLEVRQSSREGLEAGAGQECSVDVGAKVR